MLPDQTGPLGQANSAVVVGNTTGNSNATLLADTPGVQIGRDVQLQSGNTGISTIGGTNTSGTVYYTGNIILGTSSSGAMPLTVTAAAGGTVELDGPIIRESDVTGFADSLSKIGAGTLILSNSTNDFQGGLVVDAGTVILTQTGALPDGSTLTVGAGSTFIFDPSVATLTGGAGSAPAATTAGVAGVPEPGSVALLLAAAAGLAAWRLRRRSASRGR